LIATFPKRNVFVYPEVTKSFISDTEEISDQILVFPRVNLEPFGWPKVTTFEILGIDALLHFAVESTFLILQLPENQKVAECADGVVRDPVHRWSRGARARRTCAASITPSATSTPAESLRGARFPALQHPACPLDTCARRNRQVRTSTRTLRPATREVAQRAQRHARVLRSGRR
jgi:hypothetical protein